MLGCWSGAPGSPGPRTFSTAEGISVTPPRALPCATCPRGPPCHVGESIGLARAGCAYGFVSVRPPSDLLDGSAGLCFLHETTSRSELPWNPLLDDEVRKRMSLVCEPQSSA
jgi:hypothetical protein